MLVSLGHFKLKSPTKGQTSKINFLNEKSYRRDIQKSDGSLIPVIQCVVSLLLFMWLYTIFHIKLYLDFHKKA